MTDVAIINGGIKIAPMTKLKVAQNNELSKRMLDIVMSDQSNPQALMEAQARLAALQQELGPAFDPLLVFAKNEALALGKQREFNAANPAYATMRKYGAYEVEYRRGNKTLVDRVSSEKEAKALVAERGGQLVRLGAHAGYRRYARGVRDSGAAGGAGPQAADDGRCAAARGPCGDGEA